MFGKIKKLLDKWFTYYPLYCYQYSDFGLNPYIPCRVDVIGKFIIIKAVTKRNFRWIPVDIEPICSPVLNKAMDEFLKDTSTVSDIITINNRRIVPYDWTFIRLSLIDAFAHMVFVLIRRKYDTNIFEKIAG